MKILIPDKKSILNNPQSKSPLTQSPSKILKEKLSNDRDATTHLGSFVSSVAGMEKMDLRKVSRSFEEFKWILRLDKPMDIIQALISSVKNLYGCTSVTFYPLDYHVVTLMTNKEFAKSNHVIHQVEFGDEETG